MQPLGNNSLAAWRTVLCETGGAFLHWITSHLEHRV